MSQSSLAESQYDFGKLSLTKKELKIIYNNLFQSIVHKLSLRFPPTDPRLEAVTNEAETYLTDTFQQLVKGLLVDGQDVSSMSINEVLKVDGQDDNVETFDSSIDNKLKQILIKNDELVVEVTRMKRTLPMKVQDLYQDLTSSIEEEVSDVLKIIDEETEEYRVNTLGEGISGTNGISKARQTLVDDELVQFNFDDLNDTYRNYLELADSLNKKLPSLKLELQRYSKTVNFLKTMHEQQNQQ